MKIFKYLMVLLCIAVIFFLPPPNSSCSSQEQNIILNVWIQDSTNNTDLYFSQAIERFENAHPGMSIHLKVIQGDDLKAINYMTTEILNRTSPDILILSLANYNQFATEGRLYSLDNYIATYEEGYFINNVITSGLYQNHLYGIAYDLNPEVLIYRKDFLSGLGLAYPETFKDLKDLEVYLTPINKLYSLDQLNKIAFAFPTMISHGTYLSSLLNHQADSLEQNKWDPKNVQDTLGILSRMYQTFDISPYHYKKTGAHPFFLGQAAFSIEPLSLIYSAIEKDNNLLRTIGIMPISDSNLNFSYSENKYISIMSESNYKKEASVFLDFFFRPSEVLSRYYVMNLPVILEPLIPTFLSDTNFDNTHIIDYVRAAFHYPIDPNMPQYLKALDTLYETEINK